MRLCRWAIYSSPEGGECPVPGLAAAARCDGCPLLAQLAPLGDDTERVDGDAVAPTNEITGELSG